MSSKKIRKHVEAPNTYLNVYLQQLLKQFRHWNKVIKVNFYFLSELISNQQ